MCRWPLITSVQCRGLCTFLTNGQAIETCMLLAALNGHLEIDINQPLIRLLADDVTYSIHHHSAK